LDEALLASQYDDVDSLGGMGKRLELVSALCSYFVEFEVPLKVDLVEKVWNTLFLKNNSRHRLACLRWLTAVLRPKELESNSIYFAHTVEFIDFDNLKAKKARAWVLEQLTSAMVPSPGKAGSGDGSGNGGDTATLNLRTLGKDAVECFLSLFIWVIKDEGLLNEANKDNGSMDEAKPSDPSPVRRQSNGGDRFSMAKEVGPLLMGIDKCIKEQRIVSWDALITLAIGSIEKAPTSSATTTLPTSTAAASFSSSSSFAGTSDAAADAVVSDSDAASRILLDMSHAMLKAQWTSFDLVKELMARIEKLSDATSSVAVVDSLGSNPKQQQQQQQQQQRSLEHCLGVLCAYLKQTSNLCATPAHQAHSLGTEKLVLQVSLDPALAAAVTSSPSSLAAAGASMAVPAEFAASGGQEGEGAAAPSAALTTSPPSVALTVHINTPLADVVARAVTALAPRGGGGGGGAGLSNEGGERFIWRLRPVFAVAAAAAATTASRSNNNNNNIIDNNSNNNAVNNNAVNMNNNPMVFSSHDNATLKGLAKTVRSLVSFLLTIQFYRHHLRRHYHHCHRHYHLHHLHHLHHCHNYHDRHHFHFHLALLLTHLPLPFLYVQGD